MNKQSNAADAQFRKMTETPVSRLIISLGIPTTVSMLITNIYNMADSYFVSKISLSAGGATGVVFGLMAILQAFGFMFGHGSGSNISRMLGSRHMEKANKFASTGFFSALLAGTLIMVGGLIFMVPLIRLLGSTDTILPHARDYAFYILIAAPVMTASCVLNNILRYEGKASLAMIGLTTGGLLNMGLDPVFIFLLHMDIRGAGLATALSQYISFFILLAMFLTGKTQSRLSLRYIAKDLGTLGKIILTGLPSLARQGLNSMSTMVLNAQAKPFGDAAIAAMGYVARTTGLIFSVGLGIGQGYQPVAAFNYGAGRYSRVKKGTLFTMGFGVCCIGALSALCFRFAPEIIALFRTESEVIDIGSTALRIQCMLLPSLAVCVAANMLFQSIGKSIRALCLACLQSGLIFIPLVSILPRYWGILGIQASQPLAYFTAAVISVPFMIHFFHHMPKEDSL